MSLKKKVCLGCLACILIVCFTSCDFRHMSKREVEEQLEEWYGQEFTVLSSASVTDDYYDDDVWRVKVYVVSPKDNPDTSFYAYNIVEGESFGVPGFRNSLRDTYSLDIFAKAFEKQATNTDIEYTFNYFHPIKSSSAYYSSLNVSIESVTPENLNAVCTLLSQAYADTFVKTQNIPSWVTIKLTYREPTWPEDESISVTIDKYNNFYWNEETQKRELWDLDTDAEAIREYILSEASWYEEKYIQAQ